MTPPSAEPLLSHAAFLRGLARGLLRDEQAAEDVAQEAMMAAIERPPAPGNLRAWLARVTRNLAVSSHRGRQRRALRERLAARPEGVPSVADDVARLELQRSVVEAVLALEEPYRGVIVLRYFDGLSIKGVARRLDVPVETVRTRLRRAHAQLRGHLDKAHGGDRGAWALGLFSLAWPTHAAATAGGIALMGIKTKVVIALAAIAALVFIGQSVLIEKEPPARVAETPPVPEQVEQAVESEPPAPEPIDFARIDRDLDVHGTVVDENGEPIVGATIVVVRRPGSGHDMSELMLEEVDSAPGGVSEDGSFSVRLSRGEQADLRISAQGYAPRRLPWRLAGGRERVILQEGRALTVRVVDPEGRPVEGARVEHWLPPRINAAVAAGVVDLPARVTDEEGRCTWEAVDVSAAFPLFVSHPAFWIGNGRVPRGCEEEVEVVLAAGASVRGQVTDRVTGKPVPGAYVSSTPMVWPKSVRATAQGRYEIHGLGGFKERGRVRVFVWGEGYKVSAVDVTGKETVDVALERGLEVAGRFVDEQHKPVADVLVSMIGGEQLELDSRWSRSDADGKFVIRGLRPGVGHALIGTKPGYARLLVDAGVQTGGATRVELGDIQFGRGYALEGSVLNDRGDPIPFAVVLCVGSDNKWGHGGEVRCLADDLGRFRFRVAGPAAWVLHAEMADRRTFSRDVQVDRDLYEVKLTSARVNRFIVRVRDESGAPVVGAFVNAWRGQTNTNGEGLASFEIPTEAASGWVLVSAEEAGYLNTILRNQRYDSGELVVVLRKGRMLRGRVLDDEGRGLERMTVDADWTGGESRGSETDGSGAFWLLVPGDLPCDVRLSGRRDHVEEVCESRRIRVEPGQNDIEIRTCAIVHDRKITVRVVDPDGAGAPGITVLCSGLSSNRPAGTTDANGALALDGLPSKELTFYVAFVQAADQPWAPPHPQRAVPEGQGIVLTYRKAVFITGRVLVPEGVEPRAAVMGFREEMVAYALTEPDGTFRLKIGIDDLAPLNIRILPGRHVDPNYEGPKLAPAELEDVEPGATGVEIRLEKAE